MSLWSWGSDIYGRLGHGTEDKNLNNPTEVKALSHMRLKAVACGSAHTIVVDERGQTYTWGKCHFGQLGHGELDRNELVPRPVEALKGVSVASVAAGDSHVLALTREGRVFSWGIGFYGTLGHGDETNLALPKAIEKLSGHVITLAAAGANHSVVLSDTGQVWVWGRDHCRQLGLPPIHIPGLPKPVHLNQKVPVLKPLDSMVCTQASVCSNVTLLLLDSGLVLSYGSNEHGELGRQSPSSEAQDNPRIDPGHFTDQQGQLEQVKFIKAGWKHCAAITASGVLYTWGHGAYGRLGLGHSRDVLTPSKVAGLNAPVRDVSCGESHTLALDEQGQLWAWGSGHYGKLGISVDYSSFVEVPHPLKTSLPNISGIHCGTNHSIAYKLII